MTALSQDVYQHYAGSSGNKKFVSATAKADKGDAQAIVVAPSRSRFIAFEIGAAMLQNRSGSTAVMGLGVRYKASTWTAGQVTAAGAYTADTTDAQDEDTGDFPMHDRSDSGSGFLVSATERFNILGIVQSAAGDQVAPVKSVEYWDGTAWRDIVASLWISDTLIGGGTGEKVLCWPMPFDWAVGGSGTSVPATKYNLRVRHTHGGAGTADPVASQIFVGYAKMMLEAVLDNAVVSLIREHPMPFPRSGDALFPVTDQPHRANTVEVDVRFYA